MTWACALGCRYRRALMMYCFDRYDSMDQVKRSVQNELSIFGKQCCLCLLGYFEEINRMGSRRNAVRKAPIRPTTPLLLKEGSGWMN